MPECPKCGYKVREEMIFCPNCGASLKAEQTSPPPRPEPPVRYTNEKAEKHEQREKREKAEKNEKHEKGEYSFIGPLIGGLVLIFLGLAFYLELTGFVRREYLWALFFVIIGIIIIFAAIYASVMAQRKYPKTRLTIRRKL